MVRNGLRASCARARSGELVRTDDGGAELVQLHEQPQQAAAQRPGRVRFEYKNSKKLMLASGGQVAVFDAKSNQGPQVYPLGQTPLSIILDQNVNLARKGMVTGHSERKNTTVVKAHDPAHPQYGSIEMVFTAPTELRQWVVTDDTGKKTTVILGEMKKGVSFKPSTFAIQNEINRRK